MDRIPETMKALVKRSAMESYEYVEVPVPRPKEGELLVQVRKVALCGTDIQKYKWNEVAKLVAEIPFTPGHEMVGEIVATGPAVSGEFQVGKRVCVENHFFCGHCYQCTHDLQHICQNLNQFGYGKGTHHGGCQEYTIIPQLYAYLLTTDLDDARASILERCGPVGLLAVGIAKSLGATKIMACDIVDAKLAAAKKVGATVTINCKTQVLKDVVMRETSGNGVGRIMEATGANTMAASCFELLRKGGQIVLVGLVKGALHIENPLSNVVFKSLTLKTVHGRRVFRDWEESERLLHQKMVNTEPIITHDFPMSQFEKAFEVLLLGNACKVLLTPGK